MAIAMSHIRGILMPGLILMSHDDDPVTLSQVPDDLIHIRRLFEVIPIETIGDLDKIPSVITIDGAMYEKKMVFAGRVYDQTNPARLRADLAKEWQEWRDAQGPNWDGMCDTYKEERNANRLAYDAECEALRCLLVPGYADARGSSTR